MTSENPLATPENPLAIDVATRTTRGRRCPRCNGKIIPSDRAVYQSAADPDATFPIWQCERCGYEEMSARPATAKTKAEPAKHVKKAETSGSRPEAAAPVQSRATITLLDPQGRQYPADVLQLLERLKQGPRTDG